MKRNRFLSFLFSILIAGGICLGIGLLAYGVLNLPDWAASQFGPPAPELSRAQKIVLAARLLPHAANLKTPADPAGAEQSFQVDLGESPQSVVQRLQQLGLIADADLLRNYLVYSGLDKTIQAGNYQLSPRLSPWEIAHALQDATPEDVTFNILPGWRVEEIAAALPTSGLSITPEEFLDAVANLTPDNPLYSELPRGASLEGFLAPGSYQVKRNIAPSDFVRLLEDRFLTALDSGNSPVDLRQGFARQNLALYQAVILASIVQREAVVGEEMPVIASVFLNRLQAGMKLDSDPTVQYALGYNSDQKSWWTNPLSKDDLQVNSPYNTYLNWSLPPGPISNPSLAALQAVASPAQTDYYFFRAACDGSGKHVFAQTLEQHIQNACP